MKPRMFVRILLLCFTAVVTLALSACGLRIVNGSGNVVTESRSVSDFTAVNLNGIGELIIEQGDAESLTIETDDNLLEYIETGVSQDTLIIGANDDFAGPILRPSNSIRYRLTVKELDGLSLSGAGSIEAATLDAEDVEVTSSGAGEIEVAQLTANRLTATLSGAGRISLAGEVSEQTVTLSGIGEYEAGDLASQSATVTLSGAGSATVWVSDELDIEISGAGTIRYYGSPQVNSDTSGIGTIEQLGDK